MQALDVPARARDAQDRDETEYTSQPGSPKCVSLSAVEALDQVEKRTTPQGEMRRIAEGNHREGQQYPREKRKQMETAVGQAQRHASLFYTGSTVSAPARWSSLFFQVVDGKGCREKERHRQESQKKVSVKRSDTHKSRHACLGQRQCADMRRCASNCKGSSPER